MLVKMAECSVRYNELDISADSFVIFHDLTVIKAYTGIIGKKCAFHGIIFIQMYIYISGQIIFICLHLLDNRAVPFCEKCSEREKSDCPLVTSRGSYLSLWNTQDPCGCYWERQGNFVKSINTAFRLCVVTE